MVELETRGWLSRFAKRRILQFRVAVLLWAFVGVSTALQAAAQSGAAGTDAAPRPAETSSTGTASQPQGKSPGFTLHQTVRRVVVDVVVTDNQGHPVLDLQPSDFHVSEDGKAQDLRQFEERTPESFASELPPLPPLPAHTFMNLPATADHGPATVILYDMLNTPLDAQAYAHQAMTKFLSSNEGQGQTAIFVLSDRLHLLKGFSDNQEELLQAVNGPDANRHSSALLQGASETDQASQLAGEMAPSQGGAANGVPGGGNGATSGKGSIENTDPGGSAAAPVNMATALAHMESLEASALLDMRVDTTLEALTEIARFLAGVPGRKNLLWLSGSFPVSVAPDPSESFGSQDALRNYSEQMQETSDLLNRSQVAVYPVDVRGLKVNPMFDASSSRSMGSGSAGAQASLNAVQDFNSQQSSEHSAMDLIGEETGGRAFYNTNGLEGALRAAVTDGSNYYSLTYAPTNPHFDGGVRRIKVTVDRSGCHLAYRRTYFADDLATNAKNAPDLVSADPAQTSLAAAMQAGTPPSHELVFAAQVDAYGGPAAATPGQMQSLLPYLKQAAAINHAKFVAPQSPIQLQTYVVHYAVLGRELDLDADSDEVARPRLSFAIIAFDKDGIPLSGIQTKIDDSIPASHVDAVEREGYRAMQAVFVPIEAALLRIAVEDRKTNRIGTMEVNLPLAPALAAASHSGP